jgi:hypothetical protein
MSAFAQTLLRSSRYALHRNSTPKSPVAFALSGKSAVLYRKYATEAFKRDKPHVNIGTQLPLVPSDLTARQAPSATSTTARRR